MKRFLPRLLLLVGLALGLNAAPRPISIDAAHSSIAVDVRATGDSFTATLAQFTATLVANDASPASAGPVSSAEVSFRVSDIKTGNDKRDRKMIAWFEAEQFPEGRFSLTKLTREGSSDRYVATGTLTLHGQEQPIEFPVTAAQTGGVWNFNGEATLDTRDFKLPIIRLFGLLTVDSKVKVRFHLQAKPAAS